MADLKTVAKFAGWFLPFFNGLLFAVGVPGNILVLRVFSDRQPSLPIHTLVDALAVAELLVCLCRMVILYLSLADDASIPNCRISDASLYFSIYIALFLLTAVAFDRYAVTCKPTQFKISLQKTKLIIATCFICAIMLSCALPVFGEYDIHNGRLCSLTTSSKWLTDMRLYSLLGLTVVAFLITASLYVAISRAIRRRAKVQNDRRNNRTCLSLISGATRVSLSIPQIPSLGGPPSAPPPRVLSDDRNVATTSDHESPVCSADRRDTNPESETSNERVHQLKEKHAKRKVRFDDLRAQTRCREFPIPSELMLTHSPPPPPVTSDSNMARMVFAKMLVFSLTWIPLLVMTSLEHFASTALGSWLDISLNFVLVNSALNMAIFSITSRQFRADCVKLFRGIRCFWQPRFERNRPIHLLHPYWIR